MIRYHLACAEAHGFEGWFRNAADFEAQAADGRLACPVCGSAAVARALMTPALVAASPRRATDAETARSDASPPTPPAATSPATVRLATPDPRRAAFVEALRELRRQVTENADYVGERFAEEARRMHYGETERRGIYGEATIEEARGLAQEGVAVQPLPIFPEDRN